MFPPLSPLFFLKSSPGFSLFCLSARPSRLSAGSGRQFALFPAKLLFACISPLFQPACKPVPFRSTPFSFLGFPVYFYAVFFELSLLSAVALHPACAQWSFPSFRLLFCLFVFSFTVSHGHCPCRATAPARFLSPFAFLGFRLFPAASCHRKPFPRPVFSQKFCL